MAQQITNSIECGLRITTEPLDLPLIPPDLLDSPIDLRRDALHLRLELSQAGRTLIKFQGLVHVTKAIQVDQTNW
jgi:hypothetical protein